VSRRLRRQSFFKGARMAVTDGHGNPPWSREETILALDLYFKCDGSIPSKADNRVVALSALLRSLPYHIESARRPTFRNPDGVVFKLQNLKQVATGKGLANVSRMDRLVWEQFGRASERIAEISKLIWNELQIASEQQQLPQPEEEFSEGWLLTSLHMRRERSPKLREKLLSSRRRLGTLACDICDCTSPIQTKDFEDSIFEAHHIIALCGTGPRITRLSDLALLCACCHRLLHRAIATRGRWISINEMRQLRGDRADDGKFSSK